MPHRFSALSGEKIDQIGDSENRKSPIARWPHEPLPWFDFSPSLGYAGFQGEKKAGVAIHSALSAG
jgi:hypothetical protein